MTKKGIMELSQPKEWQLRSIRFTGFTKPSIDAEEVAWWETIVGEKPDSRTSHPKSGEFREEGEFETGVLTLNIQPLRIDWHLRSKQKERPDGDFETLGEFQKILESFLKLMRKWFSIDHPDLIRIAFGETLLLPVENRQTGYKRISDILPNIKIDPENSSDFLYQINRPRQSTLGIPELKINRLCKWAVFVSRYALINFDPKTYPTEKVISPEIYSCRLEQDINTNADFNGIIPKDKHLEVFEELVENGKQIVNEGDIP